MIFVVVGVIILFLSLIVAIVSLIREFGQRGSDDEVFYDDFQGLELANAVVPTTDIENMRPPVPEEINLASTDDYSESGSEDESLEEVVPFPWEVEGDFSKPVQIEKQGEEKTNFLRVEPDLRVSRDDLRGEVSIQDLKQRG